MLGFSLVGANLNTIKANIGWIKVCRPKSEGDLGIKSLKEANIVSIKLIWRIILNMDSLWVLWVKRMLLRDGFLWSIRESTSVASWMWRNFLKYRHLAQSFHQVQIGNGKKTFFWHDIWSPLGKFLEVAGQRGTMDMNIPLHATVAEAITSRCKRRRRHRVATLNCFEDKICRVQREIREVEDTCSTPDHR